MLSAGNSNVCVCVCVCVCVLVAQLGQILSDHIGWRLLGSSVHGKNTGVSSHSLLQGIFLIQG